MNSSPAQVPDFRTISAVDMAEGIRSGTWSSLSIVRAHIDWIQQINGDLNAVVVVDTTIALDRRKRSMMPFAREGRTSWAVCRRSLHHQGMLCCGGDAAHSRGRGGWERSLGKMRMLRILGSGFRDS